MKHHATTGGVVADREGGAIVAIASTADRARARALLEHALTMSGMSPTSVAAMTEAALAVSALDSGSPVDADADARTLPTSRTLYAATRPGDAAPRLAVVQPPSAGTSGSPEHAVDSHLRRAGGLLSVIESLTQVATRLDAALVLATRQQTAAIGRSLLAERGVDSPEDLSSSQRARWRACQVAVAPRDRGRDRLGRRRGREPRRAGHRSRQGDATGDRGDGRRGGALAVDAHLLA